MGALPEFPSEIGPALGGAHGERGEALDLGPWLFGARTDLSVFGGTAVFALALVAARRALGWPGELPEWGWVVAVLGVDVAHVYATLFRTYFDGAELRRHPRRYVAVPLGAYAAGVLLHLAGGAVFFRALAYLAVFHFVRQQVGWAALYRARGRASRADAVIDGAALYAATGYPLLYWHAHVPEKDFAWLVRGDFLDLSTQIVASVAPARALWAAALGLFAVRQAVRFVKEHRIDAGRCLLVASTAATWYLGIVGSSGDFDFTMTNVLVHGIPYMALLFSYGRGTARLGRTSLSTRVLSFGVPAFLGTLLALALVEEGLWDRFVFHDHEWLFGAGSTTVAGVVAAFVVPLLAVPQATHYVLDGLLWRRREPALAGTLP
jgi:hypothetical protein